MSGQGDPRAGADAPPAEEPPFAELYDATVSREDVVALLASLREHVGEENVRVVIRQRRHTHVADTGAAHSLADAEGALLGTPPRAVQLSYPWDGGLWRDTLMPTQEGGVRIVRARVAALP